MEIALTTLTTVTAMMAWSIATSLIMMMGASMQPKEGRMCSLRGMMTI